MTSNINKLTMDYDANKVTGGASEPPQILVVSPSEIIHNDKSLCNNISETNSTNSTNSTDSTDLTDSTDSTVSITQLPSTNNQLIIISEGENEKDSETSCIDNSMALVTKTHSDLAIAISNITTVSRVGLDIASFISHFALGTAKISTSLGLDIARTMTGVVSDRIVQATKDEDGGIIDASATLLHRTLSLTEQIALAGLEFTSETVQLALGSASESMNVIDTLFGTTDAAKALAEFVQLVKREWDSLYEGDDKLIIEPNEYGAFKVVKALTAWTCLQYVTSERYERNLGGWKKVRLVGLSDICNDWVHINDDDFSVYDELESICFEDEEEDEIVVIGQNKPSGSNNIVVGDLTPRDEIPEFKFNMDEDQTKRLSDLFLETTKRFSNPYLQEHETQTKKEKLFSLLHNLKRYSKFSSSAYDIRNAIIGGIPLPLLVQRSKEKGRLHRFNFARSAELSSDSVVDSSYQRSFTSSGSYQPTYFLIRDHTTKSIILALRGTMSIHDLIVDLTCEYEDFQFPEDIQRGDTTKYQIHKGMLKVAKAIATPGQSGIFEALKREMEANDDYGLVLVGHSLGAGVASILAILLASPKNCMTTRKSRLPLGRKVHTYAFATPCVMSAALSKRVQPLVTSVAYGNDVVCRLSLGHVLDLRNMVRFLSSNKSKTGEAGEETASKIIKKFIDYQSRSFSDDERGRETREEFENWFWKVRGDCYSYMQNPKLYPPGKVYWIVSNRAPYSEDNYDQENLDDEEEDKEREPILEEKTNKNYFMLDVDVEKIFQEVTFSPRMMMDHFPHFYENVLKSL
ncbi:alpha/beta-hydrolase [Gigaspora margarita]|uniref:sn-1-specific diacylglycerol lipase n=1 Tax=Gigaspora margarita TaxID=4874 RepID=A0A8H4AKU1_GIGMA|nr:alpha/beta-hydrolase [Gigaspora margarita]